MPILTLILMVFALVLFGISALAPEPWPWRQRALAAGLAAWVASQLFGGR